ncbi:MAG TPA: HAD family hydrolase [Terriglobia bacterium]|nr:HAD family hydrolase [Terriglobia bacterium]
MPLSREQVRSRARKVKLLLLDVDGVLTDGRIYYVPRPGGGMFEIKTFHSRDGIGIRYAREAGLKIGIISGRSSDTVRYRAAELKLDFIEEHHLKKIPPYERILRAAGAKDDEVCYVGDDLVDLPILKRVGFAVCVQDGHSLLHRHVDYVTKAPGGLGAVRETIEIILDAQGRWKAVVDGYLNPAED